MNARITLAYRYVFVDAYIWFKAQSHIQSRTPSARKNEEFWFVRCNSLGVHQNSLINLRERRMYVIHLLCASTSALSFCMFKNVSVFPRVNRDARGTSDLRQSNVRHTYIKRSKLVVFSLTDVCSSHTYMAHSPRMKKKIESWFWKSGRVDSEFTANSNAKSEWTARC